jgi:hypothetical protein
MCFMLFVGTDVPLPLKEWDKEAPDVWVRSVGENEAAIRAHFTKPVVQYVGASSSCGCDFPHWLLFNGKAPADEFDERDEDQKKNNYKNASGLAKLLRESGERAVEFYGVWAGKWAMPPIGVKDIALEEIVSPSFLLGEQVFYRVRVS